MSTLRKKWKRAKDKVEELRSKQIMAAAETPSSSTTAPTSSEMVSARNEVSSLKESREAEKSAYERLCQDLWLPKNNVTVNSSTRRVLGWTVDGGYSFRIGGSVGVGYVTAVGMEELLKTVSGRKEPVVLVREIDSLQYRFAKIRLIIE